jgi:hypothetical protein
MREVVIGVGIVVGVTIVVIVSRGSGALGVVLGRTSGVRVLGWKGEEDGRIVPVSLEVDETVILLEWVMYPEARHVWMLEQGVGSDHGSTNL